MCQRSPSWFCPLERHLGVQPTSLPQSGGPEEAGLCHSWGMEEKKQPLLLQNHFTLLFLWPRVSVTGPSLSPALTSSQGAFPDTTLLRCGDSGEQHCDFCPPQTGRQGDRRKLHTQAPIGLCLRPRGCPGSTVECDVIERVSERALSSSHRQDPQVPAATGHICISLPPHPHHRPATVGPLTNVHPKQSPMIWQNKQEWALPSCGPCQPQWKRSSPL
uniref:uncharacterized protein LOC132686429 isoform X1 n=1 Tax=Panthera onca TaxID=9690 RepID=UPI0029538C1E|nr:uncharacterized protein LOC132686429 isoform X1 [Panthera onca]